MNMTGDEVLDLDDGQKPEGKGSYSKETYLRRVGPALVLVPLLLIVGDLLLFNPRAGVNYALYFTALVAAIAVTAPKPLRATPGSLAPLLLAELLLLEWISLPSLVVAITALGLFSLDTRRLLPSVFEAIPGLLARFGQLAPIRFMEDLWLATKVKGRVINAQSTTRLAATFVVPILLTLLFVALFRIANPIIDDWLNQTSWLDPLALLSPGRLIFWAVLVASGWTLIRPRLRHKRAHPAERKPSTFMALFFSENSMTMALVLFNLLFAVQTLLDLSILWGGVGLPEGMTYAQYAHRGAYPLVWTALLAALFVLIAMRRNGPGETSKPIRLLVYAWVGQNVLLCLSAIQRLHLYVEQYLLTELRLFAGLWMVLVMLGLVSIVARIYLRKSNSWLWAVNLSALGLTLVGLAAVDTSQFIARYNVHQSTAENAVELDISYLVSLGPTIIPALDELVETLDLTEAEADRMVNTRHALVSELNRQRSDWRSWSWRNQRLANYLAAVKQPTE